MLGWGRSPGVGNGIPLQYSFLENPVDRGAWWATVHGVAKSQTWLSICTSSTHHQDIKQKNFLCKNTSVSLIVMFYIIKKVESESHSVVSDSLQPHGLQPTKLLCPWNSPGQNTGVGRRSLLQGIFPTRGIKPRSPALQADSLLSELPGKPECQRIDAFKLWCWRRLLRVPWTVKRSNQSILKKISPEYSLEGLMLKLKLQYFGHLIRRAHPLEKTLMLGKTGGRRRTG